MNILPDDAIQHFRSRLKGPLFQPLDAGYEQARCIWNAMVERKPGYIVQCRGVADIKQALLFARTYNLPLAIRGGGHNIAGDALCEAGLVLDLSQMRSVRIDPYLCRAYVAAGATLADFDHEAQVFALATPLGINSTTGVAGLTLGGGFGWLSRKFGMTVDNLVSADVITATGELIHASSSEHADLFWALRGGGGNFGVVTMFEYQLHPLGPDVLTGLLVYPLDQARTVLSNYRDAVAQMPDELSVWAVLRQAPPLPFLAPQFHGREVVVLAFCYAGPVAAGRSAIDSLRQIGQPCGEHIGVQPYTAWQQTFDPLLAPGARNYWKSHNLAALEDGAIDVIIDQTGKLASSQCEIFLGLIGGQTSRPQPDATAYAHRDALFVMNVHARWDAAADDERCVAWAREVFTAMAPYASAGVYVNFLTQDESARISAAYGPNYAQLAQVKKKYDPANLFRHNQNIQPAP